MFKTVLKRGRPSGRASLYVTHDQAEAMTLSSRVVVLVRGAVQQIAPPRELHDRPANLFVPVVPRLRLREEGRVEAGFVGE